MHKFKYHIFFKNNFLNLAKNIYLEILGMHSGTKHFHLFDNVIFFLIIIVKCKMKVYFGDLVQYF